MNTVGDLIGLFKWIFQMIQDIFGLFNKKNEDKPAE